MTGREGRGREGRGQRGGEEKAGLSMVGQGRGQGQVAPFFLSFVLDSHALPKPTGSTGSHTDSSRALLIP